MSRFFTETSSSHTNSSTAPKQAAHEAICKDFKKFFLGFLSVDSSGFNGFDHHPEADIRLAFFNTLSSSFIDTFQQTLAPMMVSYDNKPGVSHLFLNTRQLPDEHPLWTQEGRLDFYSEFMNNLIQATIEKIKNHPIPDEGQTFIARISEEMPHFTEEKILGLLNAYFNVFQKDFHASTAFERKYQILESLVQ
jgi:hypothetical protein